MPDLDGVPTPAEHEQYTREAPTLAATTVTGEEVDAVIERLCPDGKIITRIEGQRPYMNAEWDAIDGSLRAAVRLILAAARSADMECEHAEIRRDPITNQRTCKKCGANMRPKETSG